MAKAVASETAEQLYKQAIDEAVTERNIEWLVYLIRRPPRSQEIRDHLADVIEGLLSKRTNFPNRKPKQDLEKKRRPLAERVWEVKKEKGWKLRSVVDFIAKEMRTSPGTVWAAWRDFGPALLAGDHFRQRYEIDALVDTIMTAGRDGRLGEAKPSFGKLSYDQMNMLDRLVQETLEFQDGLRRKPVRKARSKKVRT